MPLDLSLPPKLWLPPKPAIIRALSREELLLGFLPGFLPPGAAGATGNFPVIEATNTGNEAVVDSTYTCPLPTSIQAGDLLIIVGALWSEGLSNYNTPSGWTQLFQSGDVGNMRGLACFYKVAAGTEGASVAMTTTAVAFKASTAYRISNYTGAPEAGTAATGSSSAPNPPSVTASWGSTKNLFIAMCSIHNTSQVTQTAPSNYSSIIQNFGNFGGGDLPRACSAVQFLEAATDNPGTFGSSVTSWAANTVVVRGK